MTASDSAGGDSAGETAVDTSVLGEPDPASGGPVVIGFGAGFDVEGQAAGAQGLLDGAEVAVQYRNEYRQGLGGRPIELVTCDMGALPETAIDCANQFVEQGVTATLLPVTSNGGSAVPVITGAGIPYVSFAATSFEELATEGAFSIAGGGAAGLGTVAMDAAVCASALQAYRTLGLDTPLYVQPTCIADDIAQSIPGIYDGMYLATSLTNSEDEAELFAAMIEKYAPDREVSRQPVESGQFAIGASTVVSFAGALGGIGDPTSEAISAGLESAGEQPLFLGAPVTFDCGEPILAPASSLCSVQGHLVRLDADANVTEAQLYDPTELFETALAD